VVYFRSLAMMMMLVLLYAGCTDTEAVSVGFKVTAYDGRSHEYTIQHNFADSGKNWVKKMVAVCEQYQVAGMLPVSHETACVLPTGNSYPFTKVLATNELLIIIQGEGSDSTTQRLKVLSVEILPDGGCR
jgi:hypothetical protein